MLGLMYVFPGVKIERDLLNNIWISGREVSKGGNMTGVFKRSKREVVTNRRNININKGNPLGTIIII
jgi:hypothetical protein